MKQTVRKKLDEAKEKKELRKGKMETVGVKLPLDIIAELDEIARDEDRSRSQVGRRLLMVGLAVVRGEHKAGAGSKSRP